MAVPLSYYIYCIDVDSADAAVSRKLACRGNRAGGVDDPAAFGSVVRRERTSGGICGGSGAVLGGFVVVWPAVCYWGEGCADGMAEAPMDYATATVDRGASDRSGQLLPGLQKRRNPPDISPGRCYDHRRCSPDGRRPVTLGGIGMYRCLLCNDQKCQCDRNCPQAGAVGFGSDDGGVVCSGKSAADPMWRTD